MFQIPALRTRSHFLALGLAAALPAACGAEQEVTSSSVTIDRSVRTLTGAGGVTLAPKAIKGTYGSGCKVKSPDGKWELKLNDASSTFQVALNDSFFGCPLTLTAVSVQIGSQTPAVDFSVAPPIVLKPGYALGPSAVNTPQGALGFYANARLSGLPFGALGYTNNFVIDLLYSDDALACGATAPPAIYATVNATGVGGSVPPPNYLVSFDSLQLVVDGSKIVQNSSSGNVVLTLPSNLPQAGEQWRIFDESTPCCSSYSFAEIDSLYKNGAAKGSGTLMGAGQVSIPWSSFDLLGRTLPRSRTLIVKHTDGGGVYSYELIQILFPGPN
jgi:hypothetical protein